MALGLKQVSFAVIGILCLVVVFHVVNHIYTFQIGTSQVLISTKTMVAKDESSDWKPYDRGPNMATLYNESVQCFTRSKRTILSYFKSYTPEGTQNRTHKDLHPACGEPKDLVVLLTTRPSAFSNRAAIRLSWGRYDSAVNKRARKEHEFQGTWQVIFSVGVQDSQQITSLIKQEHEEFNDMLLLNYQDTYMNLPNKTMLSIEWIANNCRPKYLLKTDDDCFVNIFDMVAWVNTLDPQKQAYIGRVNTRMPVIRDPKHRNFVSKDDHALDEYRPYCAGGGYVLAGNILKNVSKAGKQIKQIINEDAYMGMVNHAIGVQPHNEERFLPYIFYGPSIKKLTACEWKDNFLMHGVFGKHQLKMHWDRLAIMQFRSICEKLRR